MMLPHLTTNDFYGHMRTLLINRIVVRQALINLKLSEFLGNNNASDWLVYMLIILFNIQSAGNKDGGLQVHNLLESSSARRETL